MRIARGKRLRDALHENIRFARTRANLYYNAKVRRQRYLYESTVEHISAQQVKSKHRLRKLLKRTRASLNHHSKKIGNGKKNKNILVENTNTKTNTITNARMDEHAHQTVLLEVEIDDSNGDYERAWFDEDGFPRTARDKNGRFVNPWSVASSTPPFSSFLRWRRERMMNVNSPANLREPQSLEEREEFLPIISTPNTQVNSKVNDDDTDTSVNKFKSNSKSYSNKSKSNKINDTNIELQWIGHSTCLVEMDGFTILTDPVFSNHAAPIPAGVPRFTPPALTLKQLQIQYPNGIDAVVISHDHYDHLDVHSLREMEDRNLLSDNGKYFVPLGHKHYIMRTCGIAADKIMELEWWQSSTITCGSSTLEKKELKVSCAPAQHWCSRTPFDRNLRLWCSWAFHTTNNANHLDSIKSFYFAGDTGFPDQFPLHEQIGERLGPFDVAALPIGAYAPDWFMKESHCAPHETVQIHRAIRARYSVGIHWGTWALADEPYFEPPQLLREACSEDEEDEYRIVFGRDLLVVRHGERVSFPDCNVGGGDDYGGGVIDDDEVFVDPHPVLFKAA